MHLPAGASRRFRSCRFSCPDSVFPAIIPSLSFSLTAGKAIFPASCPSAMAIAFGPTREGRAPPRPVSQVRVTSGRSALRAVFFFPPVLSRPRGAPHFVLHPSARPLSRSNQRTINHPPVTPCIASMLSARSPASESDKLPAHSSHVRAPAGRPTPRHSSLVIALKASGRSGVLRAQ